VTESQQSRVRMLENGYEAPRRGEVQVQDPAKLYRRLLIKNV